MTPKNNTRSAQPAVVGLLLVGITLVGVTAHGNVFSFLMLLCLGTLGLVLLLNTLFSA